MPCPSCGSDLDSAGGVCSWCGAAPAGPPKVCPGCEFANPPGAVICVSCGLDMDKVARFDAQVAEGKALAGEGRLAEAVRALESASTLYPENVETRRLLAQARSRDGELEAARRAFKEAGDFESLEAATRRMLELDPADAEAKKLVDELAGKRHAYDTAVGEVQNLIASREYEKAIERLTGVPTRKAADLKRKTEDKLQRFQRHLVDADRLLAEGRNAQALAQIQAAEVFRPGPEIDRRRTVAVGHLRRRRRILAGAAAMVLVAVVVGIVIRIAHGNRKDLARAESLIAEARFEEARAALREVGSIGIDRSRVRRLDDLALAGRAAETLEKSGEWTRALGEWDSLAARARAEGIQGLEGRRAQCYRRIDELCAAALARAEARLKGKEFRHAIASCDEGLRMKPGDAKAAEMKKIIEAAQNDDVYVEQIARAQRLADQWEWKQAVAAYKKALEARPGDTQALSGLEKVRDAASHDPTHFQEIDVLDEIALDARCLAFSPDGKLLAAGGRGGLKVWDVASRIVRLTRPSPAVESLAFSPDGMQLASGGSDFSITLHDVETGKSSSISNAHAGAVSFLAFSADGKSLVSADTVGSFRVWEVAKSRERLCVSGLPRPATCFAASADGKLFASGGGPRGVILWNVMDGREGRTLPSDPGPIASIAFSPDGRLVAGGAVKDSIVIWEADTGRQMGRFLAHSRRVTSVSWGPHGRFLASGGDDTRVRIWEVSSGRCLATLSEHRDRVVSVAYSPDGKRIASAGADLKIRLWGWKD